MATWQKVTVGDIGDQRQVWYDSQTGNMSETDPNAAAAPTEQDRVNQSIQSIISQHSSPQQQIAAIMANPEHGYRGVLQAINMGWVPNLPGVGEMIAAGQAGDDRGSVGGLGNLFEGGNLINTLVDPGGVVKAAEGGIDNLERGNYLDPMGVVDSFGGDSEVQPVDYMGMGRAADTDWLPVGRMYGRMMAAVGGAAAMGGGAGSETGATTTGSPTGSEFTGQFTGTATGNPGFTGTVPGEPGVFTTGAPGTALAPGFFSAEALAPAAAAAGATGSGWAGTAATAGTAAAPLAADALSSSSGSPDAGSFSGGSEASSFGAPSGGSSGGGSGSPSGGGGLGGGSWLNGASWMNSIFGEDGNLDWLKLAGGVLPGLLGAFASGSQAEDLEDLSHEYKQMGQPYRTRLEQLYTNPEAFLNSPEVRAPIQQGTDMLARSLSVKGNPAGSGNALQELQDYTSTQLFNRLGAERDRLAGFGGLTQYSAAAPQAAQNAVGAQRGVYDSLGGMAADIFSPPKRYRLEDLLKGVY